MPTQQHNSQACTAHSQRKASKEVAAIEQTWQPAEDFEGLCAHTPAAHATAAISALADGRQPTLDEADGGEPSKKKHKRSGGGGGSACTGGTPAYAPPQRLSNGGGTPHQPPSSGTTPAPTDTESTPGPSSDPAAAPGTTPPPPTDTADAAGTAGAEAVQQAQQQAEEISDPRLQLAAKVRAALGPSFYAPGSFLNSKQLLASGELEGIEVEYRKTVGGAWAVACVCVCVHARVRDCACMHACRTVPMGCCSWLRFHLLHLWPLAGRGKTVGAWVEIGTQLQTLTHVHTQAMRYACNHTHVCRGLACPWQHAPFCMCLHGGGASAAGHAHTIIHMHFYACDVMHATS